MKLPTSRRSFFGTMAAAAAGTLCLLTGTKRVPAKNLALHEQMDKLQLGTFGTPRKDRSTGYYRQAAMPDVYNLIHDHRGVSEAWLLVGTSACHGPRAPGDDIRAFHARTMALDSMIAWLTRLMHSKQTTVIPFDEQVALCLKTCRGIACRNTIEYAIADFNKVMGERGYKANIVVFSNELYDTLRLEADPRVFKEEFGCNCGISIGGSLGLEGICVLGRKVLGQAVGKSTEPSGWQIDYSLKEGRNSTYYSAVRLGDPDYQNGVRQMLVERQPALPWPLHKVIPSHLSIPGQPAT